MNNEYNNNDNDNQYKSTIDSEIGYEENRKEEQPKKGHHNLFSFMKVASTALVFGLVAGIAFQGFNYASGKYTNQNEKVITSQSNPIKTENSSEKNSNSASLTSTIGSSDATNDVATVAENAMPSIVSITITATQKANDIFGRVYQDVATGSGSGFIIGQNNEQVLIVTNNHVVEGAETVTITFADKTTATAVVKGTDSSSDLAVVAIKLSDLSSETKSHIKIAALGDSNNLKVGEMAIAIGNALGYGQSVTVGYISALEREVSIEDSSMTLLQTDAAINPGNSGGALLNTKGEVIGINSVKYSSEEVEGMGYAIPISDAIPIINELMNKETIPESEQAYLGIMGQDLTRNYAENYGIPVGVYVGEVSDSSPAKKAGLTAGNIIIQLNGKDATTMEKLQMILSGTRAGEQATLTIQVLENGTYSEKILTLELGSKADAQTNK